jgi:hypothetical protein
MNETLGLLMATSILALGGLGFYMFHNQKGGDTNDEYDEDNLFSSNSFWSSRDEDDIDLDEPEYHETTIRKRGGKTKRSKKNIGTKRRY